MRHLPLFNALLLTACALSAGQVAAADQQYNQVSLRAQVQQAVSHDILTVRMYVEDQDAGGGVQGVPWVLRGGRQRMVPQVP